MLIVLGLFAVIVLFAGWFLDPQSVNPGKLYLGFILSATNLLVCLVVLVLSVFSLPADVKAKAIQTVTTKPVRTGEIVFGRILGFSVVGTVLLVIMGGVGWAFVVRSVSHSHKTIWGRPSRRPTGRWSGNGFGGSDQSRPWAPTPC